MDVMDISMDEYGFRMDEMDISIFVFLPTFKGAISNLGYNNLWPFNLALPKIREVHYLAFRKADWNNKLAI